MSIFLGNEAEKIQNFEEFALKIENYIFGVLEDEEISKKFNTKLKSVFLFKKIDAKRNNLEIIKKKELNDF